MKRVIQSIASSHTLSASDVNAVLTTLSAAVAAGNRSGRLPFTFEHDLDEFPVLAGDAAQALIFGRSLAHVRTHGCDASRTLIHRTADYARARKLPEFEEIHRILGGVVQFGGGLSLIVDDVQPSRSGHGVTLFGSVENASGQTWQSLTLGIDLIANDGGLHRAPLSFPDLKPGRHGLGTNAAGSTDLAIGPLPSRGSCKVASVRKTGIIEDYTVAYRFSIIEPVVQRDLSFSDENLMLRFEFGEDQIGVLLENKTGEIVIIEWNTTSYVDPRAVAHRVVHEGVRMVDRSVPQGPTPVPPGARVIDAIAPADHVSWDGNSWKTRPLLPRGPSAETLKGAVVGIYLSLIVRGKAKPYNFRFRVDDVIPTLNVGRSAPALKPVP
ncbi:hypothetical protein HY522_06035 [bacterium]|nr:hypothetical protein [bacterium]